MASFMRVQLWLDRSLGWVRCSIGQTSRARAGSHGWCFRGNVCSLQGNDLASWPWTDLKGWRLLWSSLLCFWLNIEYKFESNNVLEVVVIMLAPNTSVALHLKLHCSWFQITHCALSNTNKMRVVHLKQHRMSFNLCRWMFTVVMVCVIHLSDLLSKRLL